MTVKITMTVYSEKNLWKMPFWPPHEMLLLLTHYYDLLQMLLGTTFKKFTNKVKKKTEKIIVYLYLKKVTTIFFRTWTVSYSS